MFEFLLPPTLKRKRHRKPARTGISSTETQVLAEYGLEFTLQRDGFRTLRLTVKPDGSILVKAPASVPTERILAFVTSRLDWIREKQTFFLKHRGTTVDFREGGIIHYLGRPFRLAAIPARRGAKPRLTRGTLELPCREDTPQELEKAFKAWRLATAKLVISRRLSRLEALARRKFGDSATPTTLLLRSLKRRWGSCSVRGEITLAVQLISLPLPLLDYVICHELCHLRRMDHSPAFHAALMRLLPDARERAARIRIWSLEHPRD